jgi:hypothetical protein
MRGEHPYRPGRRLCYSSDRKLTGGARVVFLVDLAAVIPIHHHPLFPEDKSPRPPFAVSAEVTWSEHQIPPLFSYRPLPELGDHLGNLLAVRYTSFHPHLPSALMPEGGMTYAVGCSRSRHSSGVT